MIVLGVHSSSIDYFIFKCPQREKQSRLSIACQNAHTNLREINASTNQNYNQSTQIPNTFKLQEVDDDDNHALYPEQSSKEKVINYVFKSVLESYVKEGVTKTCTRTTRVDK